MQEDKKLNTAAVDVPSAQPNQPSGTVPAYEEPNPKAPADLEEVSELETRLEDATTLLAQVGAHVTTAYEKLLDNSDDDTDATHTSDEAASMVEVRQAHDLADEAETILKKRVMTNQDKDDLERVIDELDSKIEEATPLGFVFDKNLDNEP